MISLRNFIFISIAALGLAATPSSALTFDFSYTFGDGLVVTGSLDGTPGGSLIENISDVSLSINGTTIAGPIFVSRFDGAEYVLGAVVSYDLLFNDFTFATSDLAGGDFMALGDTYFALLPDFAYAQSWPLDLFGSTDEPAMQSSWSLTRTSVPDAGVTAGMLAFAVCGLAGLDRMRRALAGPSCG